MKTRIIKIGNSHGIRIPKAVLDQLAFAEEDEVELAIEHDQLIVRPLQGVRRDWDTHFQQMAVRNDDQLLDNAPPSLTAWDANEWEW